MNKLIPLTLAALGLATPASAQITAFQHIILVIQENRTPDNMFQGLCSTPSACSTKPGPGHYNIQTTRWLDKTSPKGYTDPHANPFGLGYDISHTYSAFPAMCDMNASGACAMDGAALVKCNPRAQPCPCTPRHIGVALEANPKIRCPPAKSSTLSTGCYGVLLLGQSPAPV